MDCGEILPFAISNSGICKSPRSPGCSAFNSPAPSVMRAVAGQADPAGVPTLSGSQKQRNSLVVKP